jgi:hypothetical protein
VLENPRAALSALCAALGPPFDEAMLAWPAGGQPFDGVWAPVWYDAVEKSTSFGPPQPEPRFEDLPDRLKPLVEAARPYYERLARHRLLATTRKPDPVCVVGASVPSVSSRGEGASTAQLTPADARQERS